MTRNLLIRAHRTARRLPRQSSSRLGKAIFLAVAILSVMLTASVWMAWQSASERRAADIWRQHTVSILDLTERLRFATVTVMRGERGYLLTHDESFLAPYHQGRAGIEEGIVGLETATAGNAEQLARLREIEAGYADYLRIMAEMVQLERAGRHEDAVARIRAGESRNAVEALLAQIAVFEGVERGRLADRTVRADMAADRDEIFNYAVGAIGLLLLSLSALTLLALRASQRREAAAMTELRRIARIDELTGLANRRETLGTIDRMIASARRSGRPLSLAVLDIDHFKRVNDTWGHPAGDEVIRRVAQMAVQIVREQDLVGRLGGEEFVIVFPDCDAAAAVSACERLREGIANLPIILPEGVAVAVTLSSGVAQWKDGTDRTQLIAHADEALYEAKQHGRDQVRLAA